MLILDKNLRVVSASEKYYSYFGVSSKDTVGNLLYHLGNGQWGIPNLRSRLEKTLTEQSGFDDFSVEHEFESIGNKNLMISGRQISPGLNEEAMILMQIEEVSE